MEEGVRVNDKEEAAGLSRGAESVLFHDRNTIETFLYEGEKDSLPRLAAAGEDERVVDGELVEHPPDRGPLYAGTLVRVVQEGLLVLVNESLKGFLIGDQVNGLALQGC